MKLSGLRFITKRGEAGQGLPEYGLILALVGVLVIGVLTLIGNNIDWVLSTIANTL